MTQSIHRESLAGLAHAWTSFVLSTFQRQFELSSASDHRHVQLRRQLQSLHLVRSVHVMSRELRVWCDEWLEDMLERGEVARMVRLHGAAVADQVFCCSEDF